GHQPQDRQGPRPHDPAVAADTCPRAPARRREFVDAGGLKASPVTLPPGRARLVTRPLPAGIATETMGRVLVVCLAASAATVLGAKMTSPLSATSSAARAGSRSIFPSADRYSITRFWPSM